MNSLVEYIMQRDNTLSQTGQYTMTDNGRALFCPRPEPEKGFEILVHISGPNSRRFKNVSLFATNTGEIKLIPARGKYIFDFLKEKNISQDIKRWVVKHESRDFWYRLTDWEWDGVTDLIEVKYIN